MSVGWSSGSPMGDKEVLADCLFSLKGVTKYYDDSVLESATPDVRRDLMQIHAEERDAAYRVWQEMNRHGWYNVKQAPENKVSTIQDTAQKGYQAVTQQVSQWGAGTSGTGGNIGGNVGGNIGAGAGSASYGGSQPGVGGQRYTASGQNYKAPGQGYGAGGSPGGRSYSSGSQGFGPGGQGSSIGYGGPVGSRLMGSPGQQPVGGKQGYGPGGGGRGLRKF